VESFSGLDVGVDETAICVVDDKGKVVFDGGGDRSGRDQASASAGCGGLVTRPAVCLEAQHVRSAYHADRLVQTRAHQERSVLSTATVVDAPTQFERQVSRSGERDPALVEGLGRPPQRYRAGRFAAAVREAVTGNALVSELIDAMQNARAALWRSM
jgi:transposase